MTTVTVCRRKANEPMAGPITHISPPPAGAANTTNTAVTTRAHAEEKDEDIPTTCPLYLFITPVSCLMYLVHPTATTQRWITMMT
jgi:hypothetical protein